MPILSAYATQIPTASVKEVRTAIGDNEVSYPQLENMKNKEIQKKINDDIVLSADVSHYLVSLATLKDSVFGLHVDSKSAVFGDVFSLVVSAKGKMADGRDGHAYTALSYDLATGERLTLKDVFTDVEGAVAHMSQLAEESMTEVLSGYLEYSDILPLPATSFTLSADGITFYYPSKQLSLLSGYSGACQFFYSEVAPYLRSDAAGATTRMGVWPETVTDAKAQIQQAVAQGELPHVPVKLGEPMEKVASTYRLLRTPDEFPGGRLFVLEAPEFRQIQLISDAIQSGYEHSVVEGIQLGRGSLYGLEIQLTTQAQWRKLLGEPKETIVFTESMAYDYGLPVGQSDCYRFGENELRLHADEQGVLASIQLNK
ncbi:MAG: hypothetical protein RSI33_00410 [Clostridia bacterium]